jgi:hypothetical protein
MSRHSEMARIEAALEALLGELVAIDTAPRAMTSRDTPDRLRTAIVDAIILLGEQAAPRDWRRSAHAPRRRCRQRQTLPPPPRRPGRRLVKPQNAFHVAQTGAHPRRYAPAHVASCAALRRFEAVAGLVGTGGSINDTHPRPTFFRRPPKSAFALT